MTGGSSPLSSPSSPSSTSSTLRSHGQGQKKTLVGLMIVLIVALTFASVQFSFQRAVETPIVSTERRKTDTVAIPTGESARNGPSFITKKPVDVVLGDMDAEMLVKGMGKTTMEAKEAPPGDEDSKAEKKENLDNTSAVESTQQEKGSAVSAAGSLPQLNAELSSMLFAPHPKYPHFFEAPASYLNLPRGVSYRAPTSEERMKRTNDAFEQYLRRHKEMVSAEAGKGRFAVVSHYTEAGLGNLLPVIVSTFLYAFVSDRALLVDWPYQRARKHFNGLETVGYPDIKELFEAPEGMNWRYDEIKKAANNKDIGVQISSLACADLRQAHKDVAFLRFKSWDFFGPIVALNPNHVQEIIDAFGDDWYGTIARWLLRPLPSLREEIRQFVQKNFEGRYIIGLQIRRNGFNQLSDEQEERFYSCAEAQRRIANQASQEVAFFIAADNAASRKKARDIYGDKVLTFASNIDRASTRGVQEGIIDNFLLAFCNEMVISGGSTYGRASAGYSSFPPITVRREASTCTRQLTSMPCYYDYKYITKSACNQKAIWSPALVNYGGMSDFC